MPLWWWCKLFIKPIEEMVWHVASACIRLPTHKQTHAHTFIIILNWWKILQLYISFGWFPIQCEQNHAFLRFFDFGKSYVRRVEVLLSIWTHWAWSIFMMISIFTRDTINNLMMHAVQLIHSILLLSTTNNRHKNIAQ